MYDFRTQLLYNNLSHASVGVSYDVDAAFGLQQSSAVDAHAHGLAWSVSACACNTSGSLSRSDDDGVVVIALNEVQIGDSAHLGGCLAKPSALLQHTSLNAYEVGMVKMLGVAVAVYRPVEVESGVHFVIVWCCIDIAV